MLLVGRGSVGQLVCALLLAFVFFALQVRLCPYKIDQDNTLRAATELHVFLIIVAALVLQKTDLSREEMNRDTYNWLLAATFVLLVPFAFVVTVVSKVCHLNRVLASSDSSDGATGAARVAFDRAFVGLSTANDTEILTAYLDDLRVKLSSADFVQVITGQKWKSECPSTEEEQQTVASDLATPLSRSNSEASASAARRAQLEKRLEEAHDASDNLVPKPDDDDTPDDTYYGKFDGGFDGTFADMSDYYGGLEKLIGECRKDVLLAMEEEHCNVKDGYGWSDGAFVTSSYRVTTSPRQEWFFVADPNQVGDMSAGVDRDTGRARGFRSKVPPQQLLTNAGELITKSFQDRGFNIVVKQEEIESLPLLIEEIIAVRLYTGPMFELYNTCLRAFGSKPRGIVPAYSQVYPGLSVEGRFVTTLHALNSAVLKISRLQPAMQVYRGISRMKLPKSFLEKNEHNVAGGVEYGFMSTTSNKNVALMFAKDGDKMTASTLVVAEMGMIDRGASLDWLSQYPHEQEILLPPLTCMEVKSISDFEDDGEFEIRQVNVRLNCNLISMTIEKLLGMRKKQVQELCDIAQRDIIKHNAAPDIPIRSEKLQATAAQLGIEGDQKKYNDNKFFLDKSRLIQGLMPAVGDEIQCIKKHSGNVYGLVSTDMKGGFATSSDDRHAQLWTIGSDNELTCVGSRDLQGASLALDTCGDDLLVSAQYDGAISLCPKDSVMPPTLLRSSSQAAVTSVAVLHDAMMADHLVVSVDEVSLLGDDFDSKWLMVSGNMDGQIMLWEVSTDKGPPQAPKQTIKDAHSGAVRSLLWVEVGGERMVVSSSFDGSIATWKLDANVATLKESERKSLVDARCTECSAKKTAHKGAVTTLAFVGAFDVAEVSLQPTKSKMVIASGSEDGAVKLWDVTTGDLVSTVITCNMGVCSLAWLTNPFNQTTQAEIADGVGAWLACGVGDNTIVLVDPKTGEVIATVRGHDGPAHALMWLEANGLLVSCSSDATVRTWRVRSESSV